MVERFPLQLAQTSSTGERCSLARNWRARRTGTQLAISPPQTKKPAGDRSHHRLHPQSWPLRPTVPNVTCKGRPTGPPEKAEADPLDRVEEREEATHRPQGDCLHGLDLERREVKRTAALNSPVPLRREGRRRRAEEAGIQQRLSLRADDTRIPQSQRGGILP